MSAFVTKLAPAPAAAFDPSKGCLRICISAPVPDRDDEVVVPATLRTDQYRANPVVIRCHDQKGYPIAMAQDPLGNCTVQVDPQGRMWAEWYFAPTAEGAEAAKLYKARFLRGASIGFQSDGVEDVPPAEAERLYGVAKRLRRHLGGELLEVSAVPVPSCPAALADRWIDAKAARTVLRGPYRHPSDLVTKSLTVFAGLPARPFPRPATESTHTREVSAMATEAAVETTEKAAPAAGAPVVKESQPPVTPADLADGSDGTVEDGAIGIDDPHELMKQGCQHAGHKAWDDWCAGVMDDDAFDGSLAMYRADFKKYSSMISKGESGETDEVEGDGTDAEDDPEVEAEGKGFQARVLKALDAIQAKIAEHDEDMDEVAETLQLLASKR